MVDLCLKWALPGAQLLLGVDCSTSSSPVCHASVPGPLGDVAANARRVSVGRASLDGPLGKPRLIAEATGPRKAYVGISGPLGQAAVLANGLALRHGYASAPSPLGQAHVLVNVAGERLASLFVTSPLGVLRVVATDVALRVAAVSIQGPTGSPHLLSNTRESRTAELLFTGPLGSPAWVANPRGLRAAAVSISGPLASFSLLAEPRGPRVVQVSVSGPVGAPVIAGAVTFYGWGSVPGPLGEVAARAFRVIVAREVLQGPLGVPALRADPIQAQAGREAWLSLSGPLGELTLATDDAGALLLSRGLGMNLIPPTKITEAELLYSSAEDIVIAQWSSGKCYRRGDLVAYKSKFYESLFDQVKTNSNNCPVMYNYGREPDTAVIPENNCFYDNANWPWWHEVTTLSNKLRMFDISLESETLAYNFLEVQIQPTDPVDSFAIFGIVASQVIVTLEHPTLGLLYSRHFNLAYLDPIYPSVTYADQIVELEMPEYLPGSGALIRMQFYGIGANELIAAGTVKVGAAVFGKRVYLGLDCYGTETGITDYSTKERDVWGLPTVKEDTYSDRVYYIFEAMADDLYELNNIIAAYRATPVAWVGVDFKEETVVFGLYQSFSMPEDSPTLCTGTLEVLGMPRGWYKPYGPCDFAPSSGKTVFVCDGTDVESCYVEGACQTKEVSLVCGNSGVPLLAMAQYEGTLEVAGGPSSSLFVNGLRSAFRPWRPFNIRSAAVADGIFCIVGDDGLIAVSSYGERFYEKPSPVEGNNYQLVVAYNSTPSNPEKFFMAVPECFAGRVYSYDLGETWHYAEDSPQENIFDGTFGIDSINEDDIDFSKLRTFASNFTYSVMGGDGGRFHYRVSGTNLWQTYTVDFGTGKSQDIISIAVGDHITVAVTKDTIAYTRNATSQQFIAFQDWVVLPDNPFSSEIVRVFYYSDGYFYLASEDGGVIECASDLADITGYTQVEYAGLGTISPLGILSICNE